jgi:(1->4)-alpha-D-glucan 1-alpha-D-glucosylmutase
MMPVRATARLQLHRGFTFEDAAARVPYLHALGISHVYASPILRARAGSRHGYDVVDPAQVSPELGGEDGLRRLVAALRARAMGLVVDIVPNHMAVGGDDNAWWLDVLAHGPGGARAAFFDIDWKVPDPALRGKLLAPFLGRPYGEALAAGEIRLELDAAAGRFQARYFGHVFPIAPRDLPVPPAGEVAAVLRRHDPADAAGRERLHRLLERQPYRLAWWQAARDEINWRRFFDLADYAGLRIEDPAVFEAVHATIFRLHAEGVVDGVRVDHVDGLADPRAYCRRLRARLGPQAWIVVEKILAPGERMPDDWRVDGTTGYSFMNDVAALLHDAAGAAPLAGLWTRLTGRTADFAVEERKARRRIAEEALGSELAATALALHRVARASLATRDVSLAALRRVLLELLVQFPVYRLYGDRRGLGDADRAVLARACEAARPACRPQERYLVDLVARWLGLEPPARTPLAQRRLRLRAMTRFQQLTPPLAAKAVEDTAFYRHGRLLSRNEVGADPSQFSIAPARFHAEALQRRERFPRALLATATHDHKRGEDARARLAVLSEQGAAWAAAVAAWRDANAPLRRELPGGAAPAPEDEYMLYQTLAGHWPHELDATDADGLRALAERVAAWHLKAVREAKLRTSWIQPDADYEDACRAFVLAALRPGPFTRGLRALVDEIAVAGAANSLTQALLRVTAPGVPDLYQGTELWDFSLVDPDNRSPVEFAAREAALAGAAPFDELLEHWRDGRVKQRLIATALRLRARAPAWFLEGRYRPLDTVGPHAPRVVAFARESGAHAVLVLAARAVAPLLEPEAPRIAPARWEETAVRLPAALARRRWRDALDGTGRPATARWPLAQAFAGRSVALLVSGPDGEAELERMV